MYMHAQKYTSHGTVSSDNIHYLNSYVFNLKATIKFSNTVFFFKKKQN